MRGEMNTGMPHFIALCFIVLRRYCAFYKLKVCGNPATSKSIGAIFPIAFAHFMSLCHILVILITSSTFSLLSLWSVIFDVTIVIVLGHHKLHPYKTVYLINICVCSDCSTDQQFPRPSPSPRASLFPWDTTMLKLGQLITLQWPARV